MVITFTRTGGIVAAPGLKVHASATVDSRGGEVTSDQGYQRMLDASEAARLLQDTTATIAQAGRLRAGSRGHRPADAFRLALTLDSGSEAVDLSADDGDSASLPEFARLVDWALREADAIVRARFTRDGSSGH